MSNELIASAPTGRTVYGNVMSTAARLWNGTEFGVFTSANYPDYKVTLTEKGASGIYVGDLPSAITGIGPYDLFYYLQQGADPAEGDPICGVGTWPS